MSEFKKLLFIINKSAGTDLQQKLEGKILDTCEKNNVECTIEYTKGRGHAIELAREGVIKNVDAIIAVGGDGTINETARGVIGSKVPLGILPKGSGNGLARHLGISLRIDGAIENLFSGKVLAMDTFTINDKLSLNVSGIGFDGHISNLFDKEKKRGFWGYLRLVLKEYSKFQSFRMELELDGKKFQNKAFILAIANSSQYGNNAQVSPTASISDNLLDVVTIQKVMLTRSIPFAYKMLTGKLSDDREYRVKVSKEIKIITPHPIAYHVDGEPCGSASTFNILIQPNSLDIIVPASGTV